MAAVTSHDVVVIYLYFFYTENLIDLFLWKMTLIPLATTEDI